MQILCYWGSGPNWQVSKGAFEGTWNLGVLGKVAQPTQVAFP
jgi:hypothetical protein